MPPLTARAVFGAGAGAGAAAFAGAAGFSTALASAARRVSEGVSALVGSGSTGSGRATGELGGACCATAPLARAKLVAIPVRDFFPGIANDRFIVFIWTSVVGASPSFCGEFRFYHWTAQLLVQRPLEKVEKEQLEGWQTDLREEPRRASPAHRSPCHCCHTTIADLQPTS